MKASPGAARRGGDELGGPRGDGDGTGERGVDADTRGDDRAPSPTSDRPLSLGAVYAVSLGSVPVFGGLAWLIARAIDAPPLTETLRAGAPLTEQIALGTAAGAVSSAVCLAAWWRLDALAPFRRAVARALADVAPGAGAVVTVSLCAGFAEELLFRGVLQPWLGAIASSLLFVGVHGMLDPRSRAKLLFGAFIFAVSLGLAALFTTSGLLAAMSAHAAFNLVQGAGMVVHDRRSRAMSSIP